MVGLGQLTKLCVFWAVLIDPALALASEDAPRGALAETAIPAQPLAQALSAFSSSTHLQLVYVSQLALGKESQDLPAGLPAATALQHLLEGTGVDFLFLNDHTVKLFEQPRAPRPPAARPGRDAAGGDTPAAEPLDEVVVSATKRAEILDTVPMSISVLSPEDIEASGMQSIAGIAAVTTSVEYDYSSQYGPGILTNLAIRGISADKGDATTGIYIDDTPIQAPHTTFGNPYPLTFDMAQVEVLKGPQGVLFGRGAEGGAVRFVTNEPSTTTMSQLYRTEVSSTDDGGASVELGAAAGGPLVDGLVGARVSAWYREDGGYINHIDPFTGAVTDPDSNRSAARAFRIAVAYEPNEALRLTPSFSHQSVNLHDSPVFYDAPPQPGPLDNGKLLRQPAVDDLNLASITAMDRLGFANLTSISSYVDRTAAATVDTTNVAGIEYYGGFGGPLGPAFPTSYEDAIPTQLTLKQVQISEEARLTSADSQAPLKWLGGFFYSRLRQNSTQDTYAITAPTIPGVLTDEYNTITEISGFGQAQWSFNSFWRAGAGLRAGTLENSYISHAAGLAEGGSAPFAESSRRSVLAPTPRFDLSYQPDSRDLFYAAIAKGFRAGGAGGPPVRCGAIVDPATYQPDTVWSFELGAKNQLFDRRMHVDASVFDIQWNGIQERLQDACGNSYMANAGAARSRGFDLSSDGLVTDRFTMALAVGYLDVRYTRSLSTAAGQPIIDSGTVVGGVPSVPAPWSGTGSARYEWPVANDLHAYLRAEEIVHSHSSGPFTELDPRIIGYDPRLVADPATYLLNFQLGMSRLGANVRLFLNNVTNEQPVLQRYSDAPGSALLYAYTLRPRTVGVRGDWSF